MRVVFFFYFAGEGESTQCPVCLADIEVGTTCHRLPCNHHFHSPCILEWLKNKHTCPVCRFEILPPGEGGSNFSGEGGNPETQGGEGSAAAPQPMDAD